MLAGWRRGVAGQGPSRDAVHFDLLQLAVSASQDHSVRVWDLASGQCLHVFTGHVSEVTALAVPADGSWLASASKTRTVRHRMLGSRTQITSGAAVTSYQPMTLADLGRRLARLDDTRTRWKLVWEFLEEYRWEPDDVQLSLLQDEPPATGDERWDALLAALAEHLAAQDDLAAAGWTEIRVLQRPWFPAELETQRADALVWAPAAFRKHGVYQSARDLEAA